MSLDQADGLTPQIGLAKLITSQAPSDVEVKKIIVMAPKYMEDLAEILSSTPSETLQTYFVWKAVQSFAAYIESDVITPYIQFSNVLQGKVVWPC